MRITAIALLLVSALGAAPGARADHRVGHLRPAGAAAAHFPDGFPPLVDAEWDWPLGGFGGTGRSAHLPVVFVHGNNTDAATWYPVASWLVSAGWEPGDLWAPSYNGVGCTNDGGLFTRNDGYSGWTYQADRTSSTGCVVTSNDVNVSDVAAFVEAVLAFTGAPRVHLVGHSLGVTVARKTLFAHPHLYGKVAGFVGIAGANHGTSFCPPGSDGIVNSCDEIAAGTAWLDELNAGTAAHPGEAPPGVRWMTVYDGTGLGDPAFAGPLYARSPELEGAVNCAYPGFYHNDLRVDPRIVADYAAFLTAVETGAPFACPAPPPPLPG